MQAIRDIIMGPAYLLGKMIWNALMSMVTGVMTSTPETFSSPTWEFVEGTLYPWTKGIGIVLLNLFFMIGYITQASDLKESFTIEIFVKQVIKLVLANGLIQALIPITRIFFRMSSQLTGLVMTYEPITFTTEDVDGGMWLFFFIFGSLYVLVAIVCGGLIFLSVYGRFLKIYLSVAVGPIALASLAGGRTLNNTAFAWMKTFLSYVFEIFVIALVITIAGKMIQSIDFGTFERGFASIADGFGGALQSMFTMILMAASVKGADTFMRRNFGL
ncbi:hypothetical protein [Ohessyouella blattaphilus]|uniref:Type IV secretion system protein n=1 Tax=Ohessyouella blattaphilus TaxID=2949333 RepID=A0ABT1EHV7_9FIRM|nr:hypothetical protein [Ohessyouella blattaphilus]MCP1110263.1 hypothetical protein [Ohessyouella blattaphilus]MCR8563657.1 hypothetical protein [Ohessyouella blattaphilus]